MIPVWKRLFALLLAGPALLIAPGTSAQAPSEAIAIVGADILPMTGVDRLSGQTVLITGDTITAIGPQDSIRVPDGARVIDARGLTLMPGLADMHVHLAPAPGQPGDAAHRAMAVMLGHGITTARSLAGSPANLQVRAAVENRDLPGPRLYVASPPINFSTATTPGAARAAVAAAAEAGYDLVKAHHLMDPTVWQALQDEARLHGLPTAGHVTNSVGLERALAANQQVEHLDGIFFELLGTGAPERQIEFGQIPPPPVISAAAAATDADLARLADRIAAARGYQTPTLSLFERITAVDVPTDALMQRPEMRYVPAAALHQWAAQREQMLAAGLDAQTAAAFRDLRRRVVRALHDAGVPILAGSDTAQAFHIWGPGLIEEIEALHAAGLPRMDALRSATVGVRDYLRSLPNGGSALGWPADFGTVETGARADLILLRGDPSEDLSALRALEMVVAAGTVHDRAALDAMLDAAAQAANPSPAAGAEGADQQIYVMRHLPAGEGEDPALTDAARTEAGRLADFLEAADVRAVFVTPTRRAMQTAAPLAQQLGLQPQLYHPGDPQALIEAVRGIEGTVLVIGHSNTVPGIIARLGGEPPAPLGHDDFGTIWRVDAGDPLVRVFTLEGPAPAALGPCENAQFPAEARCGTVQVPEDRSAPGGRVLDIHFAVVPATGAASDAPLLTLPGGPGLGGVQSGPGVAQLFAPMRENRDLLLIDQRGTGASNRLACPQPEEEDIPGDTDPAMAARDCLDALSAQADLRHYATRQAVLDMEEVRASLGYPALDLFGMSYGTRPALDYLRLYPAHVGQTVIRAPAPVEMKLPLHAARDAQIAFDRVAAACLQQPDCAERHPDLRGDLARALDRFDADEPVTYRVVDVAAGTSEEKILTRRQFNSALFFLLYLEPFYVRLPPLIDAAAAGDFSPMMQAVSPFTGGGGTVSQIAWGLRWSVICDEDVAMIDAGEIEAATRGTFMGAGTIEAEIAACAVWPDAEVPAGYMEPVSSDKPVLILSGEIDPVAGRRWGDVIAATLPNSRQVEIRGATHLPPLPGCTAGLVRDFIDGADLHSLDLSCAEQAERPRLSVGE